MRSERDVRQMLHQELGRQEPVDVLDARARVQRRVQLVRAAWAVLAVAVLLTVILGFGIGRQQGYSGGGGPSGAIERSPSGQIRSCLQGTEEVRQLTSGRDDVGAFELGLNQQRRFVLRYLPSDDPCEGIVGGEASLPRGKVVARGGGGAAGGRLGPSRPAILMIGAVSKEATEVVVRFRTGGEQVVPVVQTGSDVKVDAFVVPHDEAVAPIGVVGHLVARLTARNAEGELGHRDFVEPLSCGAGQTGRWEVESSLPGLVQRNAPDIAVTAVLRQFFDHSPHDKPEIDRSKHRWDVKVRRDDALVGGFSVLRVDDDRWSVSIVLRCAPSG